MSAPAYTARAMDTRCFWPPDSVTPRSPISVRSPLGRISRSGPSCAAVSAALYASGRSSPPISTFSCSVSFMIHADCATYATLPFTATSPVFLLMWPMSADSTLDLPLPTPPTTMVRLPGLASKVRPLTVGFSAPSSQVKSPSVTRTLPWGTLSTGSGIPASGRSRKPPMRRSAMSALTTMVMSMGRKDMGKRSSENSASAV
mmetsp:Transcript_31750/g.80970  ORF Transcript_31750/g.80970 Transcript_31750/m.80970 type:complete len:202 (-) Transcript_31750:1255-1860(-)